MGKFNYDVEKALGPKSTHTLIFPGARGYAQHECTSVYWAETQVLQEYRSTLSGFEDISILGSNTGWESGLYFATLKDIRSIDRKVAGGFIENLRHLEKEGLDSMLQTRDFEAADASWVKALGVCRAAKLSFNFSRTSLPTSDERNSVESNAAWWGQLGREGGNAYAVLIIEFWYRLIKTRLSEVIRLIERGDHLATKHGRAPRSTSDLVEFVDRLFREVESLTSSFELGNDWSPPPREYHELRFTAMKFYLLILPEAKIRGDHIARDLENRLVWFDFLEKQLERFMISETAGTG